MTVHERLKRYKLQKARVDYLKLQLEGLLDNIKYGHGITETKEETIEGVTFRKNVSDMPMGGGYESSKTERIALNVDDDMLKLKADTNRLFEEKREMEQKIIIIEQEVKVTETVLSALNYEERFVIEKWFFDQMRITYIQDAYYDKFKKYLCYATVKNIKSKAFEKMEKVTAI